MVARRLEDRLPQELGYLRDERRRLGRHPAHEHEHAKQPGPRLEAAVGMNTPWTASPRGGHDRSESEGDRVYELTAVVAGRRHSCGVTSAGAAYCWGENVYGHLGDGTTTQRLVPTLVAFPLRPRNAGRAVVLAAVVGRDSHAAVMSARPRARCTLAGCSYWRRRENQRPASRDGLAPSP